MILFWIITRFLLWLFLLEYYSQWHHQTVLFRVIWQPNLFMAVMCMAERLTCLKYWFNGLCWSWWWMTCVREFGGRVACYYCSHHAVAINWGLIAGLYWGICTTVRHMWICYFKSVVYTPPGKSEYMRIHVVIPLSEGRGEGHIPVWFSSLHYGLTVKLLVCLCRSSASCPCIAYWHCVQCSGWLEMMPTHCRHMSLNVSHFLPASRW